MSASDVPRPRIVVWYLPGAPDDFVTLREILGAGDGCDVVAVQSMAEWIAPPADVLVLRGTTGHDPSFRGKSLREQIEAQMRDPDTARKRHEVLEARRAALAAAGEFPELRGRRVLGIGEEAGQAFEALGLDIRAGATATFFRRAPAVLLGRSELVPAALRDSAIDVFDSPNEIGSEGLHFPRTSDVNDHVEVLARCVSSPNYAPLARQQNYVFCCVGADARTWTEPFRRVIQEITRGLSRRPLEPHALSEWPTASEGMHEFDLAQAGSVGESYDRELRFRFDAPVLLSVELDVADSEATMLLLHRDRGHGDMDRLDGKAPSTLLVHMPVTEGSIRANRDRHWIVKVVNFDPRHRGRYRLKITISRDARISFADGLFVSIAKPPADTETIEGLLDRLRSDDVDTSARAEAALAVVGSAAARTLEPLVRAKDRFAERYAKALARIRMHEK
jgi:hypothetical protein